MRNDVAVELFYDGGWHDLVPDDDVLADPIVITRGDGDEGAAPRPAALALRLNNDDDMYRTSNPESPLYGKAGVNTPMRASVGGAVRGYVEASSWKAGQTRDFRAKPKRGKAWVDVEGGGLLQRVNQWTEKLKSPFRQYNDTLAHVVGYWPGEQARGSSSLLSTTPGAQQTFFRDIVADSQYRPPGSAPLLDMGDSEDAEVGGQFARNTSGSPTAGWQWSWVARYSTLTPGADTLIASWGTTDDTAYGLYVNTTTGQLNLVANQKGVLVIDSFASYNGYDWSQWTLVTIDAQYSAGTTTVWVNYTNADNTVSGFMNGSFSGVPEQLTDWYMSVFDGTPSGSTFGHIIGTDVSSTGGVDLYSVARIAAWTGHLGETAGARFGRLCALKGISYSVIGTVGSSYPMGPQPVASFPELLREIRDTEDGLIFDAIDAAELVLMLRGARYNQTPALTLNTLGDDHGFPNLPAEVTDDLPIHNLVTAAQRDGGEYTAEDSTSPMGTQAPPNGRGEYKQTVDVNVSDETVGLPLLGRYWLNRGTVNLPRFPQITLNLAALDEAKVAEVEAVDIGSVITIVGYREYTIRLYVIGYTETIGWPNTRTITFTCFPDQPFVVATLDTDLADSGSTVLKAAVGPTDTAVTFRTTDAGDVWNTTTPYDVIIAGQRSRVTSMGAASLVSGAYDQAATLVRGVDGVRKSLAANEPIIVADPARCAL